MHRLAEDRRHPVDVGRARYVAEEFEKLAEGKTDFDEKAEEAIFASCEGACVVIKTIIGRNKKIDVIKKLRDYSEQLYAVADNKPDSREKAGELEKFFKEMNGVAEELSIIGLQGSIPPIYVMYHLGLL